MPSRAILADIHELNLDPSKEYSAVDHSGRIATTAAHEPVQELVESRQDEHETTEQDTKFTNQEVTDASDALPAKKDKKSKSRA